VTPAIRLAAPADAPIIAEFNQRLAAETEDKTLAAELIQSGVLALMADAGRGRYFLAELNGQVVGQLMITYEWSDWRNGLFWWIQSVYVTPAARRNGVFSALYRHVAALARESGACGIRLYVESANSRAQQTYRAMGMTNTTYQVMEAEF
jgi:ribosomal protein S18 acetylase RimI-like enzyme